MADKSKARLMEFMTIKDVEEGLKKTQTVILPVGCVEQHGWHLPLSTDMYNAIELAKAVSEITGCFVAPLMPYSYSGGALPGTINIAPATISAVIGDICRSLAAQGSGISCSSRTRRFRKPAGHTGRVDICLRHDRRLKRRWLWSPLRICLNDSRVVQKKDFHAAAFETSLMLYWHRVVRKPWVTDSEESWPC